MRSAASEAIGPVTLGRSPWELSTTHPAMLPPEPASPPWHLRLATVARVAFTPLLGARRARSWVGYLYSIATLLGYSIQAQHRRAALGVLWALLTPVLFLAVY